VKEVRRALIDGKDAEYNAFVVFMRTATAETYITLLSCSHCDVECWYMKVTLLGAAVTDAFYSAFRR
jgi:hypothetical protein